jgi:SOS-response transcriptional repressor LexA
VTTPLLPPDVRPADEAPERSGTLTPRQRRVLLAIARHVAETGRAPAIRELLAPLGIGNVNGVVGHLRALARKGWIEYAEAKRGGGRKATSRHVAIPEVTAATKTAAAQYARWLSRSG